MQVFVWICFQFSSVYLRVELVACKIIESYILLETVKLVSKEIVLVYIFHTHPSVLLQITIRKSYLILPKIGSIYID